MDLISTLAGAMGVPAEQAQAVAGLVLGTAKSQVAEQDAGLASQMGAAIPEIETWQAAAKAQTEAAPAPAASGGLFGGLMSAASSGLGNQLLGAVAGQQAAEGAALVGLLGKLGLSTQHASLAAPILLDFLKSRLGEGTVGQILTYAPMLSSASSLLG
ncbi:MAG: DUF2780 domain-containing protein [Myxococcales bacterium]|nr:DUF2780 domain-containing protein [Myxococcales bacterium]MCB9684322.1 DUF2780 domain-containing protein [Alphaproteobacteria bacterium]